MTPPSNASTNTLSTATTSTYASNSATSSTSTLGGGSSPPRKTVSPPNPQIKRVSPPPHIDPSDIARANNFDPQTPPRSGRGDFLGVDAGESTPGNWSTVATPGTARETPSVWDDTDAPRRLGVLPEPDSPMARKGKNRAEPRSGSGNSGSSVEVRPRKAWVSGELENATGMGDEPFTYDGNGNANAMALGLNLKKAVHFTPSVVGGLSSTSGTPPVSPGWVEPSGPPKRSPSTSLSSSGPLPNLNPTHPLISPQRYTTDLPAGFIPDGPPSDGHIGWVGGGGINIPPSQQPDIILPKFTPNANDVSSSRPQPPTIYAPPPPPVPSPPYNPPAAPIPTRVYFQSQPQPPPPPPPAPEIELTPVTIAKAQKHCRFAISALDYEDAEQARKELRAALAVLGG